VGTVEPGEAEEDRTEGTVTRGKTDVDVLVDLDEEEGRSKQPGHDQAEAETGMIAVTDRLECVLSR
jgi:hypothetical protein